MQSQPSQKLIMLPDLQEISDFPCDIGCDIECLEVKLKNTGVPIDYSNVDKMWNSKVGPLPSSRVMKLKTGLASGLKQTVLTGRVVRRRRAGTNRRSKLRASVRGLLGNGLVRDRRMRSLWLAMVHSYIFLRKTGKIAILKKVWSPFESHRVKVNIASR